MGFLGLSGKESSCNAEDARVLSLGWEDPQDKGKAIHSSILTWRISWTEEPDSLQSIALQIVRQDWSYQVHRHSTHLIPFGKCSFTLKHYHLITMFLTMIRFMLFLIERKKRKETIKPNFIGKIFVRYSNCPIEHFKKKKFCHHWKMESND